ncbi:MAG: SGNH/GDSL hydrolase family protein [Planctomycetes bacterium]|nr:SGNH/GDSL hydrolase family protein [Planctomycetota bacterium]MCH9725051.1 SGNH/GDSL hydrolase family protein [Planctomycetota bacterium]MCH9779337.1 SGNH/GDSL hydrolase family protein [Planctomycetota bacterium]MCH9789873.1 SGNH/GDSL hydrolase family protein [Planctomycetota bacterium]
MKSFKLIPLLAIILCTFTGSALAKEKAEEAWKKLVRSPRSLKRPAFQFVENDSKLPNVLVYGDSISIAYTGATREALKGKANVYRLYCNGGDSSSFITKMKNMHTKMQDKKIKDHWDFDWDVIHFNVGLHDLKYMKNRKLDRVNGKQAISPEDYEKNLNSIIAYLKELAPKAKLIFVTTTPVPEGEAGRIAGDAARYNQIALKILKNHPEIGVNDLYGFTKPHHKEWWTKPGNVHFNTKGATAQGKESARIIEQELKKRD